jgi:tetratricopeptide (TPR) repeat protein
MSAISAKAPVLVAIFTLLSAVCFAQDKNQGLRLFHEAQALENKAASKEDHEKAISRYEQALVIFEREGYEKGVSATVGNLAQIYKEMGEYSKALVYIDKSQRIWGAATSCHGSCCSLEFLIPDLRGALVLYPV